MLESFFWHFHPTSPHFAPYQSKTPQKMPNIISTIKKKFMR
jgi:hypothetical protein